MFSTTPHGASAVVYVKPTRLPTRVRITLSLLAPKIPNRLVHVSVLGGDRFPRMNSSGSPIFDREVEMMESRSSPLTRCILNAFGNFVAPTMSLLEACIELDLETFDDMRFIGFYTGFCGVNWQAAASTHILEAKIQDLTASECEVGAGFLMLTRGDVDVRVRHLRQSHPSLQSNQAKAADTLTQIFYKLISGTDDPFITFDPEA